MNSKHIAEVATALAGNLWAWFAATEQIWFPTVGAYVRWIAPAYNLPDLRGPLAFLTLCYIGLRLGDLWSKNDSLEDLV
ncbi:hypothetical protein [Halobaculum sp. P14]|uniref:hypothetical protein n=1 Tax=Halobaculum sp. P14 TaxID=3421638 RepID=UPI003EB70254